jgi:hypothetical protein
MVRDQYREHGQGERVRSHVSSVDEHDTFRCRILSLNWGRIDTKPRRNDDFSMVVFSGKASRKRIEFMSILSNKGECWKAEAVSRSSGYRVRSCRSVANVNNIAVEPTVQVRRYSS